jgi:hypothetical protein
VIPPPPPAPTTLPTLAASPDLALMPTAKQEALAATPDDARAEDIRYPAGVGQWKGRGGRCPATCARRSGGRAAKAATIRSRRR